MTSGALVDENRETDTPGIFACGNVLQVHDLVDYVSEEAEIAGRGAAAFVKGEGAKTSGVPTVGVGGVRYVLPQRVHTDGNEDVALYWRVGAPCGKVRFTAKSGDTVIASAVRLKAAPGEMEKLVLKREKLAGVTEPITVSMEVL